MSRRLASFAALLLALLGPALVFLAAGRWILAPGERAAPSPVAVVQAQRLAANPPGILLLGSSKAATDLDPAVLATTLGTAAPVVAIEVPASSAPAWYAFLRERVYAAGYEPDLVVIYGTLAGMLDVQPNAWWSRERTRNAHLTGTDAAQRKVMGGRLSARVDRARTRGSALRTSFIETFRDLLLGALYAEPGQPWVAAGREIATPALEAEFGAAAAYRSDLPSRVLPVNDPATRLTAREGPPPRRA